MSPVPNPADHVLLLAIIGGMAWVWPPVARVLASRREWGYGTRLAAIHCIRLGTVWGTAFLLYSPAVATGAVILLFLLVRITSTATSLLFRAV